MLRPFDEAAAKRGEPICQEEGYEKRYVAGPDWHGKVCIEANNKLYFYHESQLRMKPLATVEGREVYPGDVLYDEEGTRYVADKDWLKADGAWIGLHTATWGCQRNNFSWTPPKKWEKRWLFQGGMSTSMNGYFSERITRIRIAGVVHDISEGFEVEV